MWRGSHLLQVGGHCCPLCTGEITDTTSLSPQPPVQGEPRDKLRLRLGELHVRSNSEPLKHLDKPVLQLKMHQYFDNITKEFDIALIKFDEKGIEFQVFPPLD